MQKDFFAKRLTELRKQRNVNAKEMSLALNFNEGYISQLENLRSFPKMDRFFKICDFLQVTPEEFFCQTNSHPKELNQLIQDLKKLNYKQLTNVQAIVQDLIERKH